jgi:DNA-binding CsgD family transcriptional regulator
MLFQPLADSQARLLLLLGRTKEADEQLQARLEWQRAWGCRNPGWTSTRSLAALAARALGKASEARTLATENLEAAQAFAAPREIGIALRTMAIVQPKGRIQWLRESVSALEQSEARLELAARWSSSEPRCGGATPAVTRAHRSGARLELARECGGKLVAEQARTELLASGARPQPPRATGRDTLTASERRTAAMANEGLSNQEIAHALFVSRKTVEMHLSRAYASSASVRGVSSRARSLRATIQRRDSGSSASGGLERSAG